MAQYILRMDSARFKQYSFLSIENMQIMKSRCIAPALGLLFLSVFSGIFGCRPRVKTNFQVDKWQGRTLKGQTVRLQGMKARRLILNVYSPTCKPCIDELPALNALYDEALKRGARMYIIADPRLDLHGLQPKSGVSDFEILRERLRRDVARYGIRVPVMIMNRENFHVQPGVGLITGTPETLFFSLNPLILEYNFVGPISSEHKPERLLKDSRYRFALEKI